MINEFTGKVVVLTGASRGIGKAISHEFAQKGAKLAIVSKSERIFKAQREISEFTSQSMAIQADVSNKEEVKQMTEKVLGKYKTVDILVNCAATIEPTGPFIENDIDRWRYTIQVNLIGTFLTMKYCLPIMVKKGYGRIINFSGGGSAYPLPNFSAYGCSKAAVVRLTETVAEEVNDDNVTINVIAPGAQRTDMFEKFLDAGGEARTVAEMDMPVSLVLYLASNEASHITGKFIHVNDKYQQWTEETVNSNFYTLRRIDLLTLESLERD